MSKFLKALEQADRDRDRARSLPARALSEPESPRVDDAPPPEAPRADIERGQAPGTVIEGIDPHLVSLTSPDGFEAEQYRSLRTSLELWRDERRSCVIGISSPAAADGKTTTAINLAGALTQGGDVKVLLIEADLRNPMVGADLGMLNEGRPGLVSGLGEGGYTLADLVSRRPPFRFDVVLAGRSVAAPYELFKSAHLKRLIDEARDRYDYVLLDTPPLVSLADCQVLANWLDGFLIVVAAHRTPRRLVEEALNVVGSEKTLGFVFNRDDRPLGGYGYYYSYPAADTGRGGILGAISARARRSLRRRSSPK